jgi:hypothetical protein
VASLTKVMSEADPKVCVQLIKMSLCGLLAIRQTNMDTCFQYLYCRSHHPKLFASSSNLPLSYRTFIIIPSFFNRKQTFHQIFFNLFFINYLPRYVMTHVLGAQILQLSMITEILSARILLLLNYQHHIRLHTS